MAANRVLYIHLERSAKKIHQTHTKKFVPCKRTICCPTVDSPWTFVGYTRPFQQRAWYVHLQAILS